MKKIFLAAAWVIVAAAFTPAAAADPTARSAKAFPL